MRKFVTLFGWMMSLLLSVQAQALKPKEVYKKAGRQLCWCLLPAVGNRVPRAPAR